MKIKVNGNVVTVISELPYDTLEALGKTTVKDENGRLNNSEIQNELSPITAYHLGWVNYIEEIDVFPQLKR